MDSAIKINIPNNVESIGDEAFVWIVKVSEIVIGQNVTTIGQRAFVENGYKGQTQVYINALQPPHLATNVFDSDAHITVLCEAKEAYESAPIWKDLQLDGRSDKLHIGESLDGETEVGVFSCEDNTVEIYATPYYNRKYRFSHWSDGNTDNPRTLTLTRDITITPTFVEREETWCGENLQWSYNPETKALVITGYGDMFDFVDGNDVPWFDMREEVESISLPDGITSIGDGAFSIFKSITSLTIPEGVTTIGERAFYGCSHLQSIQLPNSLESIGFYAFGASGLTSVTIPANVTWMRSSFIRCNELESIVVDSNNKIYDSREDCNAIIQTGSNTLVAGCINTQIPNSVIRIGDEAFRGLNITSLTIPAGVETIGETTFWECDNFHFVTIEDRTKPLKGNNLFDTGEKEIKILAKEPFDINKNAFHSDDIVYIPCGSMDKYKAVRYWKELDLYEREMSYNVELPTTEWGTATITETSCNDHTVTIEAIATNRYYHFLRWSDGNTDNPRVLSLTQDTTLTPIFEERDSTWCGDHLQWSFDEQTGTLTLAGTGPMWDYNMESDMVHSPWYYFQSHIQNIVFPNGITSIGRGAFYGVNDEYEAQITSVHIPASVTKIDWSAFRNCRQLQKVILEDGLLTIGDAAFHSCMALDSIHIPSTVSNIDVLALPNCKHVFIDGRKPFTIQSNSFSSEAIVHIDCPVLYTFSVAPVWKDLQLTGRGEHNLYIGKSLDGEAEVGVFSCEDNTVDIYAKPYDNNIYRFSHWSDGNTDNPRTLTLTRDTIITPIFEEIPYYTISVTCDEEMGRVRQRYYYYDWSGGSYIEGSEITFQAYSNDEYKYVFSRWSDGVTDNPRTLTLTQDTTITAIFDIIPHHTVTLMGQSLSGSTYHEQYGEQDFYYESYMSFSIRDGRDIVIQENGNCGQYLGWSDGVINNRRQITITSDTTIYSMFDRMYRIDITADENGHLDGDDIHRVLYGCTDGTFNVCASPDEGYYFTGWSDGNRNICRSIDYGYPYSDIALVAHFAPRRKATVLVGVTTDCKSMGSASGSGIHQTGDYITITATPNAGYHFVEWSDGMDGMTRSIYLISDTTLFATFAPGDIGGKCGDSLYWTMNNSKGTLTITGSGDMNTQQYTTWRNDANIDITALILPDGITSISSEAFCGSCNGYRGDYSLSNVILPASINQIGSNAFQGCSNLSHFEYLGDSAEAYNILSDCYNLQYVKAPANALNYYKYGEWMNLYPNLDTLIVTNGWVNVEYTDNIHIPAYADFSKASNTNMQRIQIAGDGVRILFLPQGLTTIDKGALQDSRYLETITIPAKVTEIGVSAFENCRSLQSITFAGTEVKTIGDWAFYNCHELQRLVLPEGITEIGKSAFYGCTYLTEITLPSTLKSIDDNGFALCSKVHKISVYAVIPPVIDAKTFEGVDKATPLHVPMGTSKDYMNAPYWKEFFNIEETLPQSIFNIQASTDSTAPRKIFRNGQVLILREGKIYTLIGIEVK